jgi:putative oxidoreductase
MNNQDRVLATFQPYVLSLFRFVTGLLLFQYGVAKLFKFPAGTMFDKVELFSLIGAAGTLELVLGGLLMIGLFSRTVAFVLSGEMAFAYFIGHFPKGFFPLLNGGTAAILFCFACLYLSMAGGGSISVDAAMHRSRDHDVDHDVDHGFRQAAE